MAKFVKIDAGNGNYHLVRRKDISYVTDDIRKSKIHLKNNITVLYSVLKAYELHVLLNKKKQPKNEL